MISTDCTKSDCIAIIQARNDMWSFNLWVDIQFQFVDHNHQQTT